MRVLRRCRDGFILFLMIFLWVASVLFQDRV